MPINNVGIKDLISQIGTSNGGPYAARVADMNGDGWPDFVTSDGARLEGDYPGHIYLYLHPGSADLATEPWERIVVYEGDVRHQNDMRLVDIDGDGRLDILEKTWSATERVVIAFQNANINDWTVRTFVTGETGKPEGISAGDLDGDGDQEIIQSGVYWDCPGGWRTAAYTQYDIDNDFYETPYKKTKSETGDIDNDGDLDVYIGSAEGQDLKLAWYENEGLNSDGAVIWTEHVIKNDFGKCHMVRLVDIDQDGDLDLCTGRSFGQNGLLIFYNNNNGASWTEQDYDPTGEIYTGAIADLDADGDLDVVSPSRFYRGSTRYYLNETPGDPPLAPTDLTATVEEGLAIQLNWQDASDNEGSFQIERKAAENWITLNSLSAGTTNYLDESTEPNTSYQYRIRAVNAAGSSTWVISNTVTTWPQAGAANILPNSGNYVNPPTISIIAELPYDKIRYTLDGSLPNPSSLQYTAPFILESSAEIRAIAMGNELLVGAEARDTFNVAIDGNFPPIAEAGADASYTQIDTFWLDGSQSMDLDDPFESLSFTWRQIAGPAGSLLHPDSNRACFIPSAFATYQFELTIADEVVIDKDSVNIQLTDLDSDLIAYWPLETQMDMQVLEQVENYTSTRNNGTQWRAGEGQEGDALYFDGSTGRVQVAPFDQTGDALTITLWVKPADLDNVEARFLSKATGTGGNDHYWMLSQNDGSQLRFRLKTDNGGTATLISSSGQISPGNWHFITARYDGQEMQLYKDAQLIASLAKTGNITSSASVPLAIGNQPEGAGERPFSGWIDDVRVYGSALNQTNIDRIFNNGQILPVEWLAFSGQRLTTGIQLDWSTANEQHNAGFTVERSTDTPNQFKSIAWVPGHNGTTERSDYQILDPTPTKGFNFYRLRQEDLDGSFNYSNIISVLWHKKEEVVVFPNPVSETLQIKGIAYDNLWQIRNGLGQLLQKGSWTGIPIKVDQLPIGNYWLIINQEGLYTHRPFVINR